MTDYCENLKFKNAFRSLQDRVVQNSKNKGNYPKSKIEAYCDLMDEVEEFDDAYTPALSEKDTKELDPETELADIVLTAMIKADINGWDLAGAIINKHNFNLTRPKRHKRCK